MVLPLALAAIRGLDAHLPSPGVPDAAPWAVLAQAAWPGARLIDAAVAWRLSPDVPLVSALVLACLAAVVTSATRVLGASRPVAVATGLGLLATQIVWSTLTAGHDALPVLLVAIAMLGALTTQRILVLAAVVATVFLTPGAIWLVLPAVWFAGATRPRTRIATAALAVVAAGAAGAWLARDSWLAVSCLHASGWARVLPDVWLPGRDADVVTRLGAAWSLAVANTHTFGLAIGLYGIAVRRSAAPAAARALGVAALTAAVAVAVGLLSPSLAVALWLAWWTPWCGAGLATLASLVDARGRRVAQALAVGAAAVVPVLLHATVVPGPWVNGQPTITRAVATADAAQIFVVDDAGLARRLRASGARLLPIDIPALQACATNGARMIALGPTVTRVEARGVVTASQTLQVPFGRVLEDVRPGQTVALALAASTAPWAGTAAARELTRLGITRAALASTPAVAAVARTDRDGLVVTGRDAASSRAALGDVVGGVSLLGSLAVDVNPEAASIASESTPIVSGHDGALAVFDRAMGVTLATPVDASAGLPVSLLQQRAWRAGVVASFTSPDSVGPGPLLLRGQSGPVDDESPRELPVHATRGWYPAERLAGQLYQWSSEATPIVTFRLATPVDLTLVMDASAASLDGVRPLVVRVNDHVLSNAWPGVARMTIPQAWLRAGDNVIRLDAPAVVQPPGDERPLGVLVRQFRVIR